MALERAFRLETARCRLRRPSREDIPQVFSATRFPGFNDGMRWDAPASEEELLAPLERALKAWDEGTAYGFTIEGRSGAEFIGRIGIRQEQEAGLWSIGFWTHPLLQGRGYMSEAALAVLDFGFSVLCARRIEAGYALWNKASERVLRKIGMEFVRHISQGFEKRGAWVPVDLLGIERQAWEGRCTKTAGGGVSDLGVTES